MHASCQGNRSGEAFLKAPVKHLACAGLRERERDPLPTNTVERNEIMQIMHLTIYCQLIP